MILQRLKAIMKERGEATLADLAYLLDAAPEAVETMLDHWIRRGVIEKRTSPCAGKSCACSCALAGATSAIYIWTGPKPRNDQPR